MVRYWQTALMIIIVINQNIELKT